LSYISCLSTFTAGQLTTLWSAWKCSSPFEQPPKRPQEVGSKSVSGRTVLMGRLAEKRNKRPRPPSPSAPMAAGNTRSVSITVPPRTNSVGPTGLSRDRKKDSGVKPPPLQPDRKVAFRPPPSSQEDSTWIMAIVRRHLGSDKSGPKYEVQDAEPQDDGQPGA